jgi:hypothetical protein
VKLGYLAEKQKHGIRKEWNQGQIPEYKTVLKSGSLKILVGN